MGEGFDWLMPSYGKSWDFRKIEDQRNVAWLIVAVLIPMVIHLGTPCTKMCSIGKRVVDADTREYN